MVASFAEFDIDKRPSKHAPVQTTQPHKSQPRTQGLRSAAIVPSSRAALPSRPAKASKKMHTLDVLPTPAPKPEPASSSHAPTNSEQQTKLLVSNVRVIHLPAFASLNQEWRLKFLPTLYLFLYKSEDVFDEFALSSQSLLNTVQETINVVYPNVSYRARIQDEPFYLLVSRRCIHLRRSRLAITDERLSGLQPD
jgi:hypothetical protein